MAFSTSLSRPVVCFFTTFCCTLILAAAPLPGFHPDAYAGQTVVIDSDVNGNVVGNSPKTDHTWGYNTDNPADLLDPNGNTVIVNSDVIGDVTGGYAIATGSDDATASGNSVTINNGGHVDDEVYGGLAKSASGSATATGNVVTVNGGTVGGNVYGGYAESDSGSATATHNTVTITGSPVFDPAITLYGGFATAGNGIRDQFTGNTLNVWNYTSAPVDTVRNFELYNFVIPVTQGNGPILSAATSVYLGDGAGRASSFAVNTLGGTGPLSVGTGIQLLDAAQIVTDGLSYDQATGKHGATLAYDWTLSTASTEIIATLNSVQAHPQAKALSESFLSGLALTTQGADVIAGAGMTNAVSAASGAAQGTASGAAGGNGFGAFGALSGGSMRYNTGSHVDMNSVSLMTGLAKGLDISGDLGGRLTLGAFVEYGTGYYDTHNSFSNASSVDGDGDTYYLGGGVLGRMDFTPTGSGGPGHWYAEGSVRMGQVRNDYDGGDLTDGMGRSANFDSSSLYYGLHLGGGYIWNVNERASLDFYGKYFWTRQEGDSVTLSTNDPVTFKDADSHRLRLGTRFAYAVNEYVSPYVGAAYEHEFDGKAEATTYGRAIDAPDLTGGTGIGEIGVSLKPFLRHMENLPLSIDLGVQGYVGMREGVTGSVQVKFEF